MSFFYLWSGLVYGKCLYCLLCLFYSEDDGDGGERYAGWKVKDNE